MKSDSSDSGARTGDRNESAAETTPSQKSNSISDFLSGLLTLKQTRSIKRGIKVLFTLFLTALLVYWIVAFYFGIVLFEF